jgi:hypothetical protein
MSVAEHVARWKANLGIPNQPPLELNPYAYTANNPLRWIDRTGFETTAPGTGTWPSGGDIWEGIKGGAATAARQCAIIAGALLTAGISGSVPSCGPDNDGPPGCKNDNDCEELLRIDTDTCNAIAKRRGAMAGEACHASASDALCCLFAWRVLPRFHGHVVKEQLSSLHTATNITKSPPATW